MEFPDIKEDEFKEDQEPEKNPRAPRWLKSLLIFLILIAIVMVSFWVSFLLGKRLLVPAKKLRSSEVKISEPLSSLPESLEVSAKALLRTTGGKSVVPGKKFYKVQAGLFNDKKDAQKVASRLRASGFNIYIKKIGSRFRVQAGAFRSRERAEKMKRSLGKKGVDSIIIYE